MSRARIGKDWIDAYFDHGVDRQNRRIFMFDDVDSTSIGIVIKALYYMDAENDKPIELFIGSFGGDEYEMFALYDVIRTLRSPIHTTAIGKCMSAAPLLVACGEAGHRFATPNTIFMVHQAWDDLGPKRVDEMKKDLELFEKLGQRWCNLMAKHTNKPASFWKSQCDTVGDKFFDADIAQSYGLIDHVWDEKEGDEE